MIKTILASILLFTATSYGAVAGTVTATLQVENMTCASCPVIVRKALLSVEGVETVTVDLETKTANVTFDDSKTSLGIITNATGKAGFPSGVKAE
ncbi:hypothetical protein MNBD_ALPHA03-909 [hydrothermal vent metagenome]|uniref:Mercuric transport protein periplasmic component n=1 Tax=hydrothermal vent metagenome TaxID=652676 RepID=A0A3B1BQ21_9ZZZZ